ncbi:MAG: winged helix DNA-binding domain-containing protein [Ilumatobacteraceae bacterium]
MTTRHTITIAQRQSRLATRHLLLASTRTDDVAAITDALVALHSTDPATVYLSATARMRHPSIGAVSKALYDDRTVVRHHAMRRTLWVLTPQTARWAHAACTVAIAKAQSKRLARMAEDSGLATDGAAWATVAMSRALSALTAMGTATARELGKAVPELTGKMHLTVRDTKVAVGGAHTRLLLNLGFEGAIVRGRPNGSWTNSEYPWTVADRWLAGGLVGEDVDESAAELARHYLARFGPASTADLQWWAGWTAGVTKRALAAIDAVDVDLDTGTGWVLPEDAEDLAADTTDEPWVALLPALDPTTMGWKNRSWYLGDLAEFGGPVFDTNGNAGPTIWVDGRVVGGWAQRKSGEIAYKLLAGVAAKRVKQIDAEAARLRDLIGDARVSVRFPAPMEQSLLA